MEALLYLVFEEYGFRSLACCTPAMASMHYFLKCGNTMSALGECPPLPKSAPSAALIVDSGYSFTHVIPLFDGEMLKKGVRRINVGGKVLTNHLKEIISFRTWNMMEETFLVNIIKERTCFVSLDFVKDMNETKKPNNGIAQTYLLPDYTTTGRGRILTDEEITQRREARKDPSTEQNDMFLDEQVLVVNNERIAVPEILFNLSDIGIPQVICLKEAETYVVHPKCIILNILVAPKGWP